MVNNATADGARREAAIRLLREASALGEVCKGYWGDVARCVEREEEVAYAVDVDVVYLYADPNKTRLYGRVFSQSSSQAHAAAAFLLGDFIVRRMPPLLSTIATLPTSGKIGLILIPPHDAELQRIGLAISHDAIGAPRRPGPVQATSAQIELLRRHLNNGTFDSTASMEEVIELLMEVSLLSNPYEQGGPKLQLERLESLEAGRFVGLRSHAWFTGNCSGLLPPRRPGAGDPLAQHTEYRQFEALADEWHRRLVSVYLDHGGQRPVERKSLNILSDAAVLARLQWINERMALESDLRRRVVLISGSPIMHRAAAQVPANVDEFSSFAAAYLRHPKAFLGAKQLAEQPEHASIAQGTSHPRFQDTEFHLADWLSIVLPRSVRQDRFEGRVDGATLPGSSVRIGFAEPSDEELVQTWEGDESGVGGLQSLENFPEGPLATFDDALTQLAERMNAQAKAEWRRNWASEIRAVVGNLETSDPVGAVIDLLRRRELASIDALYAKTDVVGAVQLLEPNERMRGLPALRFDKEYQDAQMQCDSLCQQLFRRENRPEHFDLQSMEVALQETDPSGYHARVIKAYVFACAGLWFQVRPLCRAALLAVEVIPEKTESDNRRGREAAYLLAVAERRLANSMTGVHHAEAALQEAVRRNHLPEGDLRFDSERLAQRVTRVQLEHFDHKNVGGEDLIGLMNTAWSLAQKGLTETPPPIRRWVVRQAVTNGLLLTLIARQLQIQPAQVSGTARRFLALLSAERQAPVLGASADGQIGPIYSDAVSDFVWLVATVVFGASGAERDAARVALLREVGEPGSSSSPILYIERLRRRQLREFCDV